MMKLATLCLAVAMCGAPGPTGDDAGSGGGAAADGGGSANSGGGSSAGGSSAGGGSAATGGGMSVTDGGCGTPTNPHYAVGKIDSDVLFALGDNGVDAVIGPLWEPTLQEFVDVDSFTGKGSTAYASVPGVGICSVELVAHPDGKVYVHCDGTLGDGTPEISKALGAVPNAEALVNAEGGVVECIGLGTSTGNGDFPNPDQVTGLTGTCEVADKGAADVTYLAWHNFTTTSLIHASKPNSSTSSADAMVIVSQSPTTTVNLTGLSADGWSIDNAANIYKATMSGFTLLRATSACNHNRLGVYYPRGIF